MIVVWGSIEVALLQNCFSLFCSFKVIDLLVFKTLVHISIYPIFFRVVELSIQGKFVILFMKEQIVFTHWCIMDLLNFTHEQNKIGICMNKPH